MNGVDADKQVLGAEIRELELGSSFIGDRGPNCCIRIRYDFVPASVDSSKTATLHVGPNNQVTLSKRNVENGTTTFKGSREPCANECVIIIDNDTGKVVLEKLTHKIQVKRTRL